MSPQAADIMMAEGLLDLITVRVVLRRSLESCLRQCMDNRAVPVMQAHLPRYELQCCPVAALLLGNIDGIAEL